VLRAHGKRVYFVSNNSTKSRTDYVEKLKTIAGIDCEPADVISSAFAAATWCKENNITKKIYCLGMSGLVSELREIGLQVLGEEDFNKKFAFGTFSPSMLDAEVEAVVAGFDGNLSYSKIAIASSYLRYRPHVKFVATNRDASFPDSNMIIPGGGIVVGAVELGSGRKPDVVTGKPSLDMLDILSKSHGLDRTRTCMVGDRLDTDIVFGARGGLASRLLVLTGVSHESELETFSAGDPHIPTHIAASFGQLGTLINQATALK
jgi:4-nitrophenyl phosphatase